MEVYMTKDTSSVNVKTTSAVKITIDMPGELPYI
jgi:hypothetical protein